MRDDGLAMATGGGSVSDEHGEQNGTAMLHRMIAYVRDEAVRLRLMDVATLLDHAEAAATGFRIAKPSDRALGESRRPRGRSEH